MIVVMAISSMPRSTSLFHKPQPHINITSDNNTNINIINTGVTAAAL